MVSTACSSVRAAVISQDADVRRMLVELLPTLWEGLRVCGEAETGEEGLKLLEVCQPQLVFCDLPLPDLCGMEIGLGLDGHCYPVFLLEQTQVPRDQLEKVAVDFLLKPISHEQLRRKLDDLRHRLAEATPACGQSVPLRLTELRVMEESRIRMVPVTEIVAVEAEGTRCRIITAAGESVTNWSFRELMAELDSDQFRPVQRTVLVRLAALDRLVRLDSGAFEVRLKGVRRGFEITPAYAGFFRLR